MSYTPIRDGEQGNAATFNSRFDEIVALISSAPSVYSVITPWTELDAAQNLITIPIIPATYSTVQVVALLRTDVAAAVSDLLVRPNNDTTQANYWLRRIVGAASITPVAQLGTGYAGWFFDDLLLGASAPAGHYTALDLRIMRYTEAYAKPMFFDGYAHSSDVAAGMVSHYGGGTWRGSAAVNSLVFEAMSGNFVAESGYVVYGVQ